MTNSTRQKYDDDAIRSCDLLRSRRGQIEQIYYVLSVGHEFYRPKNFWNAAADAMRIGVAITNGERLRTIGQVRVKPIQRRAFDRKMTM